ncbi:prephenate dehydratase [Thermaerobacter litoralis]
MDPSALLLPVAFQGERGAFSEVAVRAYFGPDAEPVPCPAFADAFDRLVAGAVAAAMLPVENSYAGDVGEVYDLLRRYPVRVRGELQLPVRHCLLALPGTRLGDLRAVRSHPQALAQCREFLHRHGLIAEPVYDTAAAARQVAEAGRRDLAAIASHQAAAYYGLEVLAEDIQDSAGNVTRFFHLERDEPAVAAPAEPANPPGLRRWQGPQGLDAAGMQAGTADPKEGEGPGTGQRRPAGPGTPGLPAGSRLVPGQIKTSLLFVGEDRPGALYRCLGAFARREINLTKLTARPEPGGSWQYMFFADLEGSLEEPRVREAIEELRRQATYVRIMGSYRVWQVHDADAGH